MEFQSVDGKIKNVLKKTKNNHTQHAIAHTCLIASGHTNHKATAKCILVCGHIGVPTQPQIGEERRFTVSEVCGLAGGFKNCSCRENFSYNNLQSLLKMAKI